MEPNKSLPCTTLPHITEWLKGPTMYSWNAPGHFFIQAHFQNSSGEKQSNTPSGWRTEWQLMHSWMVKPHMRCFTARNPIWQDWGNGEQRCGSMMLLAQSWMEDQGLDNGLVLKRQVTLNEFSGQIITLSVEQNIKFNNNDILIPCALLPKGEGRKEILAARALKTWPPHLPIPLITTHLSKKSLNQFLPN